MEKDIKQACEAFLSQWDEQEWLEVHGEWASAEWDDARDALATALDEARDELDRIDPERVDTCDAGSVASAMDAVCAAIRALDGQVIANEDDYIESGRLDPDMAATSATDLEIGESWQGCNYAEGWKAYQVGASLYLQWYHSAYGQRSDHDPDRDLWVLVDDEFFEGE